MKHLSTKNILHFLCTADRKEIAAVNAHIMECRDCLKKLQAFRVIYDELVASEQDVAVRLQLREGTALMGESYLEQRVEEEPETEAHAASFHPEIAATRMADRDK